MKVWELEKGRIYKILLSKHNLKTTQEIYRVENGVLEYKCGCGCGRPFAEERPLTYKEFMKLNFIEVIE